MSLREIAQCFAHRRDGHTLPAPLYLSQTAFDFDLEAIYARNWLMAGMACELPKTGSYLALTIGRYPVLLVRDRTGDIRAFHNSCRHRGSILCTPGAGQSPKLVCPYHRWTYNLDGSLLAATRMPEDFDKREHGLKPVPIKVVAGAIFICLADTPPSFDDFGDAFARYAAPMRFDALKLVATDHMIERANWKLVMENGRECYHCATGHPELATSFPVELSLHELQRDDDRHRDFARRMDALGLPHEPLQGSWWQIARFPLNEGSRSISMDGAPICARPIIDTQGGGTGTLRWAIDPHLFAHATADHVFVFSCLPTAPDEALVVSKWYVHKDAVEGVDYDPARMTELWVKTNQQDREFAENNHRGILSPGYTPGPYSPEAEGLALRFTDWYCNRARDYLASHG